MRYNFGLNHPSFIMAHFLHKKRPLFPRTGSFNFRINFEKNPIHDSPYY